MGLSNLPPGVTSNMIDNNYDEGAWEALIDDIYATKVPYMVYGEQKGERLITPEEARERWESQPKLKEHYEENIKIINRFKVKLDELNLQSLSNQRQALQLFLDLVIKVEENLKVKNVN